MRDNEEKVVEKEEEVIKYLKPSADASPPAWRQIPQDYNYKN
jgi:hypothetical protein